MFGSKKGKEKPINRNIRTKNQLEDRGQRVEQNLNDDYKEFDDENSGYENNSDNSVYDESSYERIHPSQQNNRRISRNETITRNQRIDRNERNDNVSHLRDMKIPASKIAGLSIYFLEGCDFNKPVEVDQYVYSIYVESKSDVVYPVIVGDIEVDDLRALIKRVLDRNSSTVSDDFDNVNDENKNIISVGLNNKNSNRRNVRTKELDIRVSNGNRRDGR